MTGAFASYRALVCDLDGVVYRGPSAVPHAVAALDAFAGQILYATNNASRPPQVVADHLTVLGVRAGAPDVVNSSQAAAWLLSSRLPAASTVLAVGGEGVTSAASEAGFRVVHPGDSAETVAAVIQGFGPDVRARDLGEAAYAVQAGAVWVATNTDGTLPTDRGVAPGNGTLVAAVARAVGREPDLVAGKPEPAIYELCRERLHLPVGELLAVGDRLDTDIAGANALGMDSLVVLTGVDGIDTITAAPTPLRPTFVAQDLRALVDSTEAERALELTAKVKEAWRALDAGADLAEVLPEVREAMVLHAQSGEGSVT